MWASNTNAVLVNNCQALGDLTVSLKVAGERDLANAEDAAYSLQLNAYPMPGVQSAGKDLWMLQYVIVFGGGEAAFDWQAFAVDGSQPVPKWQEPNPFILAVPSNRLPPGSTVSIALATDQSGVISAAFTVNLPGGATGHVVLPFPEMPAARFPIGGIVLNLVGINCSTARFISGDVELSYTGDLSVQIDDACGYPEAAPICEASNVTYGEIAQGPGGTLVQKVGYFLVAAPVGLRRERLY